MKKRLLALLLAGAMSVGLAACGNSGDEGSANTPAGGAEIDYRLYNLWSISFYTYLNNYFLNDSAIV